MKGRIILVSIVLLISGLGVFANEPDSAYIFAYTSGKHNNSAGLQYAWSVDRENWHGIGPEFRFLGSDFGAWGSQKKMIKPFLFQDKNELYHCLWTLNNETGQFAHAASNDLFNWKRQSYPEVLENGNVTALEASLNTDKKSYLITWISEVEGQKKLFKTSTTDFKNYTATEVANEKERLNLRENALIEGEKQEGIIVKIPWKQIDALIKWQQWSRFHEEERADNTGIDAIRFKDLQTVKASISVNPEKAKSISDELIGVFFEDINYAADGGLYAELVQNRGFEYKLSDKLGRDPSWNAQKSWSLTDDGASFYIDSINPLHENNKHFAVLAFQNQGAALVNEGFAGIPVRQGEKYNFSVFAKSLEGEKGSLLVRLTSESGEILAEGKTKKISGYWKKHELQITAIKSAEKAKLEVIPQFTGKVALDMISLFPQNTFKQRKNGLRADLAQAIADMHPRFVRFPGGCVAHGDGIQNIYHWNNTVGPLQARVPQRNIWNYHQSAGLGYFEYFQFCKDISAEPLPVLAAGVPCQNSATCGHGQQGGISLCDMDKYVQEVLDLIEWANGDKSTKWGKIRAAAGHPEPFNLKYIGIGNEDLITDVFEERFTLIYKAVVEKHPEIIVIGTVGPFYTGTDYVEGWDLATRLKVPVVDEHYYQPPGWFIHNQDFYDRYDRSKSKVYLGEYAAHLPGRPNNIETALSEALYLTSVERNADVVVMTSYAPLLAKEGFTQWTPDLIYFNNTEVKPTTGYYVQKLFGQNSGDVYIPSQISLSDKREDVKKRVALSVVRDSKTNDIILKLVNMLPAPVESDFDFSGLNIAGQETVVSVLKGLPADSKVLPVESKIQVSEKQAYTLPPYSLSVIRIKYINKQ